MSQVNKTSDTIFESLTNSLVYLAKHGTEEQIEKAILIMEEGWTKMNEVLDQSWFNKELSVLWREYLKKKDLKPKYL